MLDEIIASKKEEVRTLQMPERESVNRTSLKQALMSSSFDLGLIAEIKQASPSKGLLVTDLNVSKIAQTYENAGASAISVLTDSPFFKGEKRYIKQVKDLVHLPVLRKDFIIDEKQVEESYRLGADAILLIAGVVSNEKLQSLYEQAYDLGMECLVEVHNSEEALSLLDHVQPEMIGVNNRDLKTFRTDITHTETILKHLPKQSLVVSESGIRTRADLSYLKQLGVQGVLMGETLMKADDQAKAIQSLFANEKALR
ncbi:indole-3-glycerol phosphate synthase TrpC [Shouchella sp. JSM 1781072]|uniref:indole-3-glycerol phosphate synthase TrpC n=1 Tax=Bacillaceae TaxID=186817 RepID=UPI000C07795B|nr:MULTISPECIES: indole-3-glycerol phosphate synthase TrpC [Bacillaceae]UTR08384.1 indole-3-glycerol phosphate synthase TrpC [Alkalihalobacillus sp. LMS6]